MAKHKINNITEVAITFILKSGIVEIETFHIPSIPNTIIVINDSIPNILQISLIIFIFIPPVLYTYNLANVYGLHRWILDVLA